MVVYRFDCDVLHLLLIEINYKGNKDLPDLNRIKGVIQNFDQVSTTCDQ